MPDNELDQTLQEFLDVRQPGANYEEHTKEEPTFDLEVDLKNYKKFPRVDDNVTYKKSGKDTRGEIKVDPKIDLPDYSGPFRYDLRFTDFSDEALIKMLSASYEYYVLLVESWAAEIA